MPRSTDAQQLRQSKLQCCRPAYVEQFTAAPATRHELCAFQASTESISIRELVNHGALWLFSVLYLRNTLTYLLTYFLLQSSWGEELCCRSHLCWGLECSVASCLVQWTPVWHTAIQASMWHVSALVSSPVESQIIVPNMTNVWC